MYSYENNFSVILYYLKSTKTTHKNYGYMWPDYGVFVNQRCNGIFKNPQNISHKPMSISGHTMASSSINGVIVNVLVSRVLGHVACAYSSN